MLSRIKKPELKKIRIIKAKKDYIVVIATIILVITNARLQSIFLGTIFTPLYVGCLFLLLRKWWKQTGEAITKLKHML